MKQGILLTAFFLFICSVSLMPAFAEDKPVAAETVKKTAAPKTEQPKAQEKKAESKPAEKKADAQNKQEKAKPAPKKPAAKPAEQKDDGKKSDAKTTDKKDQGKSDKNEEPRKKEKWKEQLEEKHEVYLEWFEKSYPDKYKELIKNRDSQPEKFVQRIGNSMKVYGPIQREEKRNPELAKALREDLRLQEERDKLIRDIRKAKPEKRPEMLKKLEGIVAARFDIIIRKKQLQYDHLRKRLEYQLEKQAAELQKLKEEKDAKVQQRMDELIDPKEKLSWK